MGREAIGIVLGLIPSAYQDDGHECRQGGETEIKGLQMKVYDHSGHSDSGVCTAGPQT
jgi:hypothetical protein